MQISPWYSQCQPPEQPQPQPQPPPGNPDSPIFVTVTTTFSVFPNPDDNLATTFYSVPTSSPTTGAGRRYTVIDGTTWIIVPGRRKRSPATGQLLARLPEPTAPAVVEEKKKRDVDRAPVYDAPLAPGFVRDVEVEPVGKRDVDRPPVPDSPLAAGFVEVGKRDVDRPPVYDSPLAAGFVRTAAASAVAQKRDVDRPPVYDAPLAAGFVRKVKPGKRDVDRPPVYDVPLAAGFERKVDWA
ncbi:hypothetical protein MAPG_06035 [Magnaporthiopsis poae ATCC 64411]|uniref:Uncharacterized protein n=1 Tax=Magnaporthiopsis poae (strain ATCC 64411 / 73-15) TaxID=644358 RepID=A0A0C4E0Z3_MAGP6|nr:hypothetical protein MAPG_06035 [Magnaporthiopsis poae ATCC 64411]